MVVSAASHRGNRVEGSGGCEQIKLLCADETGLAAHGRVSTHTNRNMCAGCGFSRTCDAELFPRPPPAHRLLRIKKVIVYTRPLHCCCANRPLRPLLAGGRRYTPVPRVIQEFGICVESSDTASSKTTAGQ